MSPKYDSNMNNSYNRFIQSAPHLSQSITLSNVGPLNCHMPSHRHFQRRTAKVLFHTHPNSAITMT